MKNLLNHLTAFVLTFAMLLSLGATAFASDVQDKLVLSEDAQRIIDNSVYNETEFDAIVKSQEDNYAIVLDDNVKLPVGRLDIRLTDTAAVEQALTRNDIYPEGKEDLKQASEQAIAAGNTDAKYPIPLH